MHSCRREEELCILRGEAAVDDESDLVDGGADQGNSDSDSQQELDTSTIPFAHRSAAFAAATARPAGAAAGDSNSGTGARQASTRVVGSLLPAEQDDSASAGEDDRSSGGDVSVGDRSYGLDQYGGATRRRSSACSDDSGF